MTKIRRNTADDFIAPPCTEHIEVLYQDDALIVINKPTGLLSLSGKNPLNKDSVHYRLVQDFPSATMLHRLDFGTSGLMVLALNKQVNAHLTKQFQMRTVVKHYSAVLMSHVMDDLGIIEAPISKAEFPLQKVCFETGKYAQSFFQVIERRKDSQSNLKTTLVTFKPRTGRTHQLRVHSLEMGHPIVGCDLYRHTVDGVDSFDMAERLMLHACFLQFEHPVSSERVQFESEFSETVV